MSATLYSYLMTLPELGGRVGYLTVPAAPQTPYAIVEDVVGGTVASYYGHSSVESTRPSVTVYHKPGPGETPQAAVQALRLLMAKIAREAPYVVDTDSDGVTPFLAGSFQRQAEFPVQPDGTVTGQSFMTLRFVALYQRS